MVGSRRPVRMSKRIDGWRGLAAELELFEPLNGFALVGDDLRLPDERDRHAAHGDDTKNKNESNVGFLGRKTKGASKPCHGKGSPST